MVKCCCVRVYCTGVQTDEVTWTPNNTQQYAIAGCANETQRVTQQYVGSCFAINVASVLNVILAASALGFVIRIPLPWTNNPAGFNGSVKLQCKNLGISVSYIHHLFLKLFVMFANFKLKIRLFWVSDTKTAQIYTFLENKTGLSGKTISTKPLIYVKAIYGQKLERDRLFIPCHSLNARYFLRFCELEM